ncbi:MAG: hypothetical protein FWE98_07600 [Oscillospiraceae bacterium]|nr:hypothetical protein [Oscillospiraceae bacterium]
MKTLSLSGPDWTFKQWGDRTALPATVPGCNYHDLLRLGKIEDPFTGTNEGKALWVGEADFDYMRTFALAPEDLAADRIELFCAQLDTLCRVYVNDILVGEGRNNHIGYSFDVTGAVEAGENQLRVEFDSPMRYAAAMAKEFPTAPDMNFPGRVHIRKAQCHFGWDWGPRIPVSGITGEIALHFYRNAKLLPMETAQEHADGQVKVSVKANAEALRPGVKLRVTLLSPAGDVLARSDGDTLEAVIEKPALWWTRELSGKAEQPLYKIIAEALYNGEVVDVMKRKIGLRTIALNREKDEFGSNFQFVLNGVPIFAKGANWIPPDAFPDRATKETRRELLQQCVDANMNMIRVWGGGYYETDEFYDLCDSMGLLVWQDFAFACAPYPFDREDFLRNVKDEVEYNVTRLRHRASLALWCGNNEIESMSMMWRLTHRELHAQQGRFFWETLPAWANELDTQTPFTATSPAGSAFMRGVESDGEGDTHLWQVWHGLQELRFFRGRMTRFCSEFGQQSFPSAGALRAYAGEGEPKLSDPAMKSHQKCMSGNEKIIYYVLANNRLPKKFAGLAYLSQIAQADSVAYATEHWRRNRGRCNGSLYWQLNDCWPVTSWSSIDYTGKAKALQYFARRFNAPVSLSIDDDRGVTKVYILNDTQQARRLTLVRQLMDFSGRVLYSNECPVNAPPLCAFIAADLTGQERGCDLVLRVQLKDGNELLSERTLLFDKEKNLCLPRCAFTSSVEVKDGLAHVTIRSDSFARAVFLESDLAAGNFSDNFADLFPGAPVTLTVNSNGASAEDIQASLRVTCVNNLEAHSQAVSTLKRTQAITPPAHAGAWAFFKVSRLVK